MSKRDVGNLETDVLNWINGTQSDFKISLPGRIYDHILTQLFLENISFGQRIRESQVTKELNVSNVPVREAFIRLREEGWIEIVPNCGARIVDYHDCAKHRELYDMRLSLESGIFYCLAEKITEEQLSELDAIVNQLEISYKTGDLVEYRCLDADFHMKTVFFAGGERMQKIYRPIFLQWCIMLHLYKEKAKTSVSVKDADRSPGEMRHRALCKALEAKDGSLAAELIRKHFTLPE
jgi:DNA-binding GntR family transcriptional regulator